MKLFKKWGKVADVVLVIISLQILIDDPIIKVVVVVVFSIVTIPLGGEASSFVPEAIKFCNVWINEYRKREAIVHVRPPMDTTRQYTSPYPVIKIYKATNIKYNFKAHNQSVRQTSIKQLIRENCRYALISQESEDQFILNMVTQHGNILTQNINKVDVIRYTHFDNRLTFDNAHSFLKNLISETW